MPAAQLIGKPEELSWDVAGSLFVTPMAGSAAVDAVHLGKGETVVIAGATGGVGLTAGQLARRTGANVIGIAGPSSADRLHQYGITPVVAGEAIADDVRAAAQGRPIDAFIDAFGSGYIDLALGLGVPVERINTVVDYKGARDRGVQALGTMNAGGTPVLARLADLATTGQLDIPIAATYPLAAVQAAYRTLAGNRPFGRVVLHPQE